MILGPKELSLLDASFRQVVEPGEFDILVGASSEDIRLSALLTVDDGSGLAETLYPDEASDARSVFPASLGRGADITVPVRKGQSVDRLTLHWGEGTDCEFEILWTNGGGQFLPLWRSTTRGAGETLLSFEPTAASELCVCITRGQALLLSLDSPSLEQ